MTVPLIALTSYYNPFRGQRRRRNYDLFRKYIGVPLVTVEWSPDGRFDLSPADADVMIRVEGGDVMWQKERLLNRGLARIRDDELALDVAMIDADAVFTAVDWAGRVSAALNGSPLVQCYSTVDYLPQLPPVMDTTRAGLAQLVPERSMPSLAYAVLHAKKPCFSMDPALVKAIANSDYPPSGNPGMSTAVRLADLPHFELYEGNIVGGGDLVLAACCLGALDELFQRRSFSPGHQADVIAWAARCLTRDGRLGWVDNRLLHLWHGTMEARRYAQRQHVLGPRNYDPGRDLDRSGDVLRFRDSASDLKAAVVGYLASRDDA